MFITHQQVPTAPSEKNFSIFDRNLPIYANSDQELAHVEKLKETVKGDKITNFLTYLRNKTKAPAHTRSHSEQEARIPKLVTILNKKISDAYLLTDNYASIETLCETCNEIDLHQQEYCKKFDAQVEKFLTPRLAAVKTALPIITLIKEYSGGKYKIDSHLETVRYDALNSLDLEEVQILIKKNDAQEATQQSERFHREMEERIAREKNNIEKKDVFNKQRLFLTTYFDNSKKLLEKNLIFTLSEFDKKNYLLAEDRVCNRPENIPYLEKETNRLFAAAQEYRNMISTQDQIQTQLLQLVSDAELNQLHHKKILDKIEHYHYKIKHDKSLHDPQKLDGLYKLEKNYKELVSSKEAYIDSYIKILQIYTASNFILSPTQHTPQSEIKPEMKQRST